MRNNTMTGRGLVIRIGRGPTVARRPLRSRLASTLGLLADRITSIIWGILALGAILAPYVALKPATNYWWLP